MSISIILIVFVVIFAAELPDKSLIASLVLSQRFRKLYVWYGAAAAFLVHVIIAVTAGKLLTFLPHKAVESIVAALFLAGAVLLFLGKESGEGEGTDLKALEKKRASHSFFKAFGTSFAVVFLGEWGDITQITTANYAAKYHDTFGVAIGATLGLWAVTAFGIIAGSKVLEHIPAKTVQKATAVVLLGFAVYTAIGILR